ncbi:MAG: SMI1/KNR4 family protein [Clostridia bacterium]|nr:SMI1/KNR4 family protein [Clostridia bacterium]
MKELLLTAEAPAEFVDALLKYEKFLQKKKNDVLYIEEMIDVLVRNKVRLHNGFILASIVRNVDWSNLAYDKRQELAVMLTKRYYGDGHPREHYWVMMLVSLLIGREAYPLLMDAARRDSVLEVRACAIKSLAKVSGQTFDRNLPKDPGKWKEQDLRLDEMEAWIAEGCPDGPGYLPPVLDPALTTPTNDFERTVCAFNRRLERLNQDTFAWDPTDYSSYTNCLAHADREQVIKLQKAYAFPIWYAEFLTRFSPCNVVIPKGMYEIYLYGADDLAEKQIGYSVSVQGDALEGWPDGFVVIADRFGDPYCIDCTGKRPGVLFARHGEGVWNFSKKYNSFEEFLAYLAK